MRSFRLTLAELMVIVAIAGSLSALGSAGYQRWDYRTYETLHDTLGEAWYGRGHFTPAFPANERQRLINERAAASTKAARPHSAG